MPNTITRIATYRAPNTVTSYTFSNIPQTYNHLYVMISGRIGSGDVYGNSGMRVNGSSTSGNYHILRSSINTAASVQSNDWRTSDTSFFLTEMTGDAAPANLFGMCRIWISNYTLSRFKSGYEEGGATNSTQSVWLGPRAFVYRDNTAITSLEFIGFSNFLANSTITLYGVSTT